MALPAAALFAPPLPAASRPAVRARHAMVVAAEPIAVAEGVRVLGEGGNAVDAAVTIAFALAVTHPQSGNIGGGGFMLIREPSGESTFIDYRETAPAAASRDMFLDPNGEPDSDASLHTYRAAGVPGSVAGLTLALRRHGTIPLARALAPAIRLARKGFTVSRGLERELAAEKKALTRYPASRAIFFKQGEPLAEGDLLVQENLARTLEAVAREGAAGFYEGRVARALAAGMAAHGGLITQDDLAGYKPIVRPALAGAYRDCEILSAPPSSSGGVALLEILHMLEPFDLKALGHNSSAYVHLVSEAMKRAYADRSRWLGDPDFFEIPLAGLLSRDYAVSLMKSFDSQHATPAAGAGPGDPVPFDKPATNHFSVVDASGMAVANTFTLNGSFGCGAVAEGLGFLLNNEMDDFSAKPGAPNMYGLVGAEANSIAPRKRMLSSMTPTILVRRDASGRARPFMVLGSPGGATIISSVLQVILDVVDFDMELQAAVDAPRFHHQWKPDWISLDRGGFPADVLEALRRRGHEVVEREYRGEVQAILLDGDGGWLRGASDARGYGLAMGN
jgi:gamma-glutamyltranspeptidase/glutathione hydrolase